MIYREEIVELKASPETETSTEDSASPPRRESDEEHEAPSTSNPACDETENTSVHQDSDLNRTFSRCMS